MIKKILQALDEAYPFDGKCFLDYNEPWQLLFATILSAQCTDARVNMVTAELFAKFPTLEAIADADYHTLERIIHPTGFFRNKTKHLQEAARMLLSQYQGEVPPDINALTALPGVGRKTANVVRGHIFKIPSIVVDTHVKRVSNRLGLTNSPDPVKIEFELMGILPETHWVRYNQQAITHGRLVCPSRSPKCADCILKFYCRTSNLQLTK